MPDIPQERRKTDIELALMRRDLEDLTIKVEALTNQVHSLVTAWNTAGYIVGVVKWLAGVASAVAILWAAMRGFVK